MATDYLSIGPTPAEEDCAQVGSDSYHTKARKECEAFRKQMLRLMGEPPAGACLRVKTFPHDFGSYLELCCVFREDNEEATSYAYRCEEASPARWDAEARKELGLPDDDLPYADDSHAVSEYLRQTREGDIGGEG